MEDFGQRINWFLQKTALFSFSSNFKIQSYPNLLYIIKGVGSFVSHINNAINPLEMQTKFKYNAMILILKIYLILKSLDKNMSVIFEATSYFAIPVT